MSGELKTEYDAIVIGTGMSGGWAMKELTEAGLETLALDRGRMVEHGEYPTEHKNPWEMPNRGRIPEAELAARFPVQRRTYVLSEYTQHYFADDMVYPIVEASPFSWIQTDVVGGRSLLWARQSYRWSPMDFEANRQDGHGIDWPIRYEDLAPWYDHVERSIGVSGSTADLPQLPDGIFQKPMAMNVVEKHFMRSVESRFSERRVLIGRTATLTEPLDGRAPCHYCGPCERGCSTGSYYSTQSVALPAARRTGRLTLLANNLVESVLYDAGRNRAAGVRAIDTVTGADREFRAKLIFVCASAMGTARILLNSTSSRFPNGLGNDSGALGRYIMDHHGRVGARGFFEGFRDRYYRGNRPNGIYVPRFRNLPGDAPMKDFVRGYGMQGSAAREGWARGGRAAGIGTVLKNELRDPGRWQMMLQAFGEVLPVADNRCELDSEVTDAFGIPALRIDVKRTSNEKSMRRDMAVTAAEMLSAAGAVDVQTFDLDVPPGTTNHEMGTARMGRNPQTSVLNGWNQCHAVPNLFVTDGACMTSTACQNPSLTYLALTARACHYAAGELKRGAI